MQRSSSQATTRAMNGARSCRWRPERRLRDAWITPSDVTRFGIDASSKRVQSIPMHSKLCYNGNSCRCFVRAAAAALPLDRSRKPVAKRSGCQPFAKCAGHRGHHQGRDGSEARQAFSSTERDDCLPVCGPGTSSTCYTTALVLAARPHWGALRKQDRAQAPLS